MLDARTVPEIRSTDRAMGCNVVVALATGGLLGALVAIPYDQAFGLAAPLITPMKCLASLAIFSCLANGRSAEAAVVARLGKERMERRSVPTEGLLSFPGAPTLVDFQHLSASGSPESRFRPVALGGGHGTNHVPA